MALSSSDTHRDAIASSGSRMMKPITITFPLAATPHNSSSGTLHTTRRSNCGMCPAQFAESYKVRTQLAKSTSI
ncbi:hypothetical protein NL676_028145 [Syzygium grande]|nr:hypothetical protein NL676_028145 [Syzygium grande]